MLAVEDLFLVGLGFDIAGALVLARGVLMRLAAISRLGARNAVEPLDNAAALLRARAEADGGVALLCGGFAVQAVGFGLTLSLGASSPSVLKALVGVVLGLASLGAGVGLAKLTTKRRLKRLALRFAQTDPTTGIAAGAPSATKLGFFGKALGYEPGVDETSDDYARRVFGATSVFHDEPEPRKPEAVAMEIARRRRDQEGRGPPRP